MEGNPKDIQELVGKLEAGDTGVMDMGLELHRESAKDKQLEWVLDIEPVWLWEHIRSTHSDPRHT